MKVVKFLIATVALAALSIHNVYARDRVSVGININTYDYVAPQISHYPNTIYYSRTPTVIYYSAPVVVQYVPMINAQPRYYQQQFGNHYRNSSQNYYRDWNQGWRQHGGRSDEHRGYNNRGNHHEHHGRHADRD